MNRKAKIAYLQMVFGAILFSIGFILLLNFDLTEWYAKEKHAFQSNNHTQLTLALISSKSQHLDELELDSYMKWYCLTKYSSKNVRLEEHKQIDNLNDSIEIKFHYLLKFFSFLICSSDTIYLAVIITCLLIGCIACCCGCFRFYIYEIKVNSTREEKQIKDNESNIYELEDSMQSPTKKNDCCFKKKKTNSSIINKAINKNCRKNSFDYLKKNDYVVTRAEIACPYDYDDLPKFMYETLNDSLASKSPRLPTTSPPSLLRNNIFYSTGKISNDKYELVPYNSSDRLIRKQDNNNTTTTHTFTEYFV